MVITLRGLGREFGSKFPSCPVETFATNVRKGKYSEQLSKLIESGIKTLEAIEPELQSIDSELHRLCASEPMVQLLATGPGVALTVAASFVSVIDQAQRFRSSHEVESYLGLVPSKSTTGSRRGLGSSAGKVTPTGERFWPSLAAGVHWTNYYDSLDGATLEPGKRFELLLLSGSPQDTGYRQSRDAVRERLAKLVVQVEYEVLYGKRMNTLIEKLD